MAALFVLVDWDDGYTSDLTMGCIKAPRKEHGQYVVGERVQGRVPGFKGLHWGHIVALDTDRNWLKDQIHGPRPIPPKDNQKKQQDKKVSKPVPNNKEKDATKGQSNRDGEYGDLSDDDQDITELPTISAPKRKHCEDDEEARQARAAENKKKKERMQLRQELQVVASEALLHSNVEAEVLDRVSRLEEKVDHIMEAVTSISNAFDLLLNCKTCLKKAYRKVQASSDHQQVRVPTTPTTKGISTCSVGSPLQTGPLSPPAPGVKLPSSPSPVPGNPTPLRQTIIEHEKMETTDQTGVGIVDESVGDAQLECGDDELCFLGDASHGVKLNRFTLDRCEKAAKTAEKLALNLIEFLLTKEEIQNVTVYGNKQHKKDAMDENKRKALRSHIFSRFHKDVPPANKKILWDKLVIIINDKIRGLRNGKYKFSNLK